MTTPAEREAQWTALALLYGAPPFSWIWEPPTTLRPSLHPVFVAAVEKVFGFEQCARVGWSRLAYDYAVWYHTCDDGHGGKAFTREVLAAMRNP